MWLFPRLDAQISLLVRNSSWVFSANAVSTLLAFVKSIIIARALGIELFGNYVLIVAFVGTIQEFFNLNIGMLGLMASVLLAVALIAALPPAIKAARGRPVDALRED